MNTKKLIIIGYLLLQTPAMYASQSDWNKIFASFNGEIPTKNSLGSTGLVSKRLNDQLAQFKNDPSTSHLADMFARYIIIGNSSAGRTNAAEDAEIEKALAAYQAGLTSTAISTETETKTVEPVAQPTTVTPVTQNPVTEPTPVVVNPTTAEDAAAELLSQVQSSINLYNQAATTLQTSNINLSPSRLTLNVV